MTRKAYSISGMYCAACSANIERAVKKLDGIVSASVNLATEVLTVEYDESLLSDQAIKAAVTKLDYGI